MEKEAYERARAFDTATIARQALMIDELNEDNDKLREKIRELRATIEARNSQDDEDAEDAEVAQDAQDSLQ